jgi:hypothetical protein
MYLVTHVRDGEFLLEAAVVGSVSRLLSQMIPQSKESGQR